MTTASKRKVKTKRKVTAKRSRLTRRSPRRHKGDPHIYFIGILAAVLGLLFIKTDKFKTDPFSISVLHSEKGFLKSFFEEAQALTFSRKVQYWSEFIEKNKKGRHDLKEATAEIKIADTAPLVPNYFDCTTFVETVIALSRSKSSAEFVQNLLSVRYENGNAEFSRRNHFPEADWIPNNTKAQILEDITAQVAQQSGRAAQLETKRVDRGAWLAKAVRKVGMQRSLASISQDDRGKVIDVSLPYIEISQIDSVIQKIPNGTVVNFVRKSDDRHPVLITHQGILIREGNRVFLRHASMGGQIRTHDFKQYLNSFSERNPHSQSWPLIGINLNQIKDSTSLKSRFKESM